MSEDQMLKCLIAFVLGFLVARMMRGDGLSVGERGTDTWHPVYCDPTTKPLESCPDGSECPKCGTNRCLCGQPLSYDCDLKSDCKHVTCMGSVHQDYYFPALCKKGNCNCPAGSCMYDKRGLVKCWD